jgi:hypothetical protein
MRRASILAGLVLAPLAAQAAGDRSEIRRPEVCTDQYAPVCGERDGVRKIYSNTCFAAADGANVVMDKQCPMVGVPKPKAQ